MEARALTLHEKASLKSFLSGVYAGVILSSFRCGEKLPSLYGKNRTQALAARSGKQL